ncbi:MAG: ATP-binding cassette domain-containing protein [Bacteroidales bacterium]|nr:ATP-binding cassette domain-containing protein [Bacteroidales bacterium]
MAILLQIDRLTKSVGDRLLFGDVTFGVNEGDKIGVIAKNGTGKSTLLRVIAGKEAPDSGSVVARTSLNIGMLEQTPAFEGDPTAIEACIDHSTTRGSLILSYEQALAADDSAKLQELIPQIDHMQAWDLEDNVRQMLTQLQITDFNQRISTMSGGQRKRVALCRLLLDKPDVIILDEPTNHLDITTIEWLESYLRHQRVTLIMVTHDRYFLDAVCDKIIEIDRQQIFTYDGNYDYYLRRRQERIEAMAAELAKVKNTLRRETEWMRRQPQARAGKAKFRIDAYYDLKERSRVDLTEKQVNLNVDASYIGSKIFEAKNVSKRFGDKVILDDFNYIFARYEKVGIIGENGVGKSTFIKLLQGLVAPDSGHFDVGETVRFGYYSQDGINFDSQKKVIDAVTEIAEDIVVNNKLHFSPMQFLQHFLFSPADQQKYIHTLSGGERARLHLAVVLMQSPNFLILDEPTNDLDIVTLGILENYLEDFGGCLIIVSHDRFFLDSTVDHLFVMEGDGKVKDFPGTYTEYRRSKEEERQRQQKAKQAEAQPAQQRQRAERPRKLSFKERKELETLTAEIASLEEEKTRLEKVFSGEAEGDINEASRRYDEVKNLIDEKELRWLELSELE